MPDMREALVLIDRALRHERDVWASYVAGALVSDKLDAAVHSTNLAICRCQAMADGVTMPGPMNEQNDASVYNPDTLRVQDGRQWATDFMETWGTRRDEIDLDLMTAWFANAIEGTPRRSLVASGTLEEDISAAMNRHSVEHGSGTPDFVLAQYLLGCIHAWNGAIEARETWYGRGLSIGHPSPMECNPSADDVDDAEKCCDGPHKGNSR